MIFDFVVLGATGEEGNIASKDLLNSGYKVLLCGRNKDRVKHLLRSKNARFSYVDLSDVNAAAKVLKKSGANIALNCAELRWNIEAMKACLKSGLNYLDLGGLQKMTIKQYRLDNEFKRKNLIALLGCGSTPGISNVMANYAAKRLDSVERIDLGFAWDSNIKTFVLPYSFESIVHEITNPAIILKEGKLQKATICEFEGVKSFMKIGSQKTYCIVHSEVFTFYRYFKKKGLQNVHYWAGFPEHSFKVIEMLIELGFGSSKPIEFKGSKIKPVEFSRDILKKIEKPKDYKETEDIWVKVTGIKNNERHIIEMGCLVETLKGWEEAGSNVDTGMTISIMAQMLHEGIINGVFGVTAPEASVPPKPLFEELRKRGMTIYLNSKEFV